MKPKFEIPKLIVHGSVESITKSTNETPIHDFIIFNGVVVSGPNTDGSQDFIFESGKWKKR